VQEPILEPAEAALRGAQELWMRRGGRRPLHELLRRFLARSLAFCSVRSLASLAR
jgi:hypothetical protein